VNAVEITIGATPARLYELIADIERMGEWSPECIGCRWVGGAQCAEAGARYRGTSQNGRRRWTTLSSIVEARPGHVLAWDVSYFGCRVARWRYEFAEVSGGTLLREIVEDRRGRLLRFVSPMITGSRDRGSRNESTMHVTLERLKAAAESAT
jgi:hypothetical protein